MTPPAFVGGWLRYQQGFSYAATPPEGLAEEERLLDPNPWMRVLFIFERARLGDFAHVELLVDPAENAEDWHLRDCATRLLGHLAPLSLRGEIARLFWHADHDTRLEAYGAAVFSADLGLVEPLLQARRAQRGFERERIMDRLSDLLESEASTDIIDEEGRRDDEAYDQMIRARVTRILTEHGDSAIFEGEPLAPDRLLDQIERELERDDLEENGGRLMIYSDFLEAMTGYATLGLYDDAAIPDREAFCEFLRRLRADRRLRLMRPGERSFFGHRLP